LRSTARVPNTGAVSDYLRMVSKIRGDYGEDAVSEYLFERGFEIIARNYRKRCGEIDIIAVLGGEIAFIEVKTRKFGGMTAGIDAVTKEKQSRIIAAARLFLYENPRYYAKNARFDVAEVVITSENVPKLLSIEYYANAFIGN